MPRTMTSTELQRNVRRALDWPRLNKDALIVSIYGEPRVVIIDFEEYKSYITFQQRQAAARAHLDAMIQAVHERNKDEDPATVEAEVDEAIRAVRSERRATSPESLP